MTNGKGNMTNGKGNMTNGKATVPRFRGWIAPRDRRSGRPLGNRRTNAATGRELDGMAKKKSRATSDQPAISSDGGSPSPVAAATVLRPSAETLRYSRPCFEVRTW